MRVLELCAGYGGLGLGLQIAVPSARVVGIVERQAYCVARWQERMEAPGMEPVAIWPDLDSFAKVVASSLRGRIDCITAGFPCQPFSQAGKRRGMSDDRWIWPVIRRIISVVRPQYVFLENVPGLLTNGEAFHQVLKDLAAIGFDAEWESMSAAEAGANHFRFRVWILAHATRSGEGAGEQPRQRRIPRRGSAADAAHGASVEWRRKPKRLRWCSIPASVSAAGEGDASHADIDGLRGLGESPAGEQRDADTGGADTSDAAQLAGRERLEEWDGLRARRQAADATTLASGGRDAGSAPGGMDDGAAVELGEGWWSGPPYAPEEWLSAGEPDRAEQLHALGNGVVPLQAALAFTLLAERAGIWPSIGKSHWKGGGE